MWETKPRAGDKLRKGLDWRSGTNLQTGRISQFVQYLCTTRPCPSPPAFTSPASAEPGAHTEQTPHSTVNSCTELPPSAGNLAESRSSALSLHFGGLHMASQFSGCTLRADNLHTPFALEHLVGKLTPDGSN